MSEIITTFVTEPQYSVKRKWTVSVLPDSDCRWYVVTCAPAAWDKRLVRLNGSRLVWSRAHGGDFGIPRQVKAVIHDSILEYERTLTDDQ